MYRNLDILFHEQTTPMVKATQGEIGNTAVLVNFGLLKTRKRKLTEKGKIYLTEAHEVKGKNHI